MPDPVLNLSISVASFASSVSVDLQFQEAFFVIKELYKSAGWIHQASSKGDGATFSTTPGNVNDVIASSADVGIGTSGNGAYWVGKSPIGWIPGSDQIEVLFYVNDLSPAQVAPTLFTSSTYTGGDATTLPTPAVAGRETTSNSSGWNIIPWSVAVAGAYIAEFSDRGDLQFTVKQVGVSDFKYNYLLRGNTDLIGGGKGNYRFFHRSIHGASNVFSSGSFTSTYLRGLSPAGLTPSGGMEFSCTCWTVGNWLNGRDWEGEGIDVDIDCYHDWTADQRYLGKVLDYRGYPNNLPYAELDDSESGQTYRKFATGTTDNIWIYVPTAALPLP
jgi:hypothetical protein